jgi:transcriptional regulator with GAF, ATPase, and Fis domain
LQEGEIERVGGSDTIRVDVRVIAATNKDLAAEVAAGRFREDLFFRLNVVPILAAPLRERTGDVALLARHFLERFRLENTRPPMTVSSDALAALAVARWPGNVRELENAVERLAIMMRDATIGLEDLARAGLDRGAGASSSRTERADTGTSHPAPRDASAVTPSGGIRPLAPEEIASLGGLVEVRRRFEAACIEACLRESQGNVSAAARLLGIDRTNLHKKIQAYGLDPDRVAG